MKTLAGTLIEVKFVDMMMEIVKIVLVPIGAALLHDYLKSATKAQSKKVFIAGAICAAWIVMLVTVLQKNIIDVHVLQSANLSGFLQVLL